MARDLVLEVIEQVRGNALGEAAKDLDKVAGSTDKAAGKARDYTGNLKQLDTQIEATRSKIRALGVEFIETQDKMTGKDLRSERGLLRQLERIRKELGDAGGDGGKAFGASFLSGIGALPSQLRGVLIVSIVGAAVTLAPVIGAMVSGAVIGAVGAGGIAGGIAAASRDPRVREAAGGFAEAMGDEFFSGGGAFVQPIIESLDILHDRFVGLDLGDSWQRVAPYVTELASGIAGLADRFLPGFNRALDAAGPALSILAQELPEIGDAFSDMLIDISDSEGTLEGFAYTLEVVEAVIRTTGAVLGWLGDRFHDAVRFAAWFSGVLEDIPLPWLGDHMGEINNKFEEILNSSKRSSGGLFEHGGQVERLGRQYQELTHTFEDYLGVQLGVDQANQRVSEGLLRLREALRENGKDWRTTTEAGLANRQALISQVQALIQQREATIAAGGSAADATAKFEEQLRALEQLAIKAGISRDALRDLVGDYHVQVYVNGLPAVAGGTRRGGRFLEFAHGGEPPAGEPFWVGESGRELMQLSPRPHVFSHQESESMAAASSQASQQLAQALADIVQLLRLLRTRQPATVNVYPTEGQSPREVAAVVSRELAWNS